MTTYVDDMKAQFGRMVMCHMLADTDAELLAMADTIGVQRKWHQYPSTHRSHFDIALSKRAEAVAAGAKEITWRQAGQVTRHRRMVALGKAEPQPIAQIIAADGVPASDEARRAATRAEVLSDLDPVVLECWRLQGRKVGAMWRDMTQTIEELQEELTEAKAAGGVKTVDGGRSNG